MITECGTMQRGGNFKGYFAPDWRSQSLPYFKYCNATTVQTYSLHRGVILPLIHIICISAYITQSTTILCVGGAPGAHREERVPLKLSPYHSGPGSTLTLGPLSLPRLSCLSFTFPVQKRQKCTKKKKMHNTLLPYLSLSVPSPNWEGTVHVPIPMCNRWDRI